VSRFGLDYALDTMGVVHGGTVACNYTTYFDGSGNFNIDFVDDGGVFVPATATGEFINIFNSVYDDGATEQSVDYVETSSTYSPVVDGVTHFSSVNNYMDTGNTASVNYAKKLREDYYVSMEGNPSSNELILQGIEGSAAFNLIIRSNGLVTILGSDNIGSPLFNFQSNNTVTDGGIHKVSMNIIDTVSGSAGNFDVQILIDDVFDKEVTDINLTLNGWDLNRWLTGDASVGKDYKWYEIRSTVNGYWVFIGRLRPNLDALQGKFVNMVNDKVFTITNRIGVYPNKGATDYLDREGFNV